ncbi:molybdenum cofactor guanylyltransferase MobA [Sulfurimonas aquatica]|uniref:Probable molybdenum cofactor guanylyltransferase n=1 Tax=Sulfurimonas aquatica TaxID=2672570 RepID=A0A975GE08_9BACT|nr:molybdenum cofactor guanylyltransferase MobA [Sulfurimonas aquatica]QSZ42938.1 molybdenum cofactor guanylyltransferase MobA [Sulfurimonas aquatica]
MINIPCVIFAGGKSSRMKEDKSLLPFRGFSTLTEYQFSHLSKIFSTVYISCKDKKKFDFQADFLEDDKNSTLFAPTQGFLSSFKTLSTDRFFVISVDSPFINLDIIEKIISSDNKDCDATIARVNSNVQPLCGIYHRSLNAKFQDMLQNNTHKLGFLLQNSRVNYVDFKDEKLFLNLNYPHEYQEALKLSTN